jgi:putative tryptophan/tyrosine transport system substrate-binding protein
LGASSADRLIRFWTTFKFLEETMQAKFFSYLVAAAILTAIDPALAQQPAGKIPRIGFLLTSSPSVSHSLRDAFQQGLRGLGYVEGKNILVEYRYAEGKLERLPELAEELIRLKVDLIVAATSTGARAAKKATTAIPIVMVNAGDPISSGLIISLARPGGNITGLTSYSPELTGKRLELLKEVVPKVSRFAYLTIDDSPTDRSSLLDTKAAAKALAVQLQVVSVKTSNPDIDGAFRVMAKQRSGALITGGNPLLNFHRKRVLALAEQAKIPAIYPVVLWMDDGGLMYYGANAPDLYRRAAMYVDKILKGAKPADLPVEQPTKFEFVINLKAAKQIGLTIPPNVLARADKVIK